jgi:hypothetical protein
MASAGDFLAEAAPLARTALGSSNAVAGVRQTTVWYVERVFDPSGSEKLEGGESWRGIVREDGNDANSGLAPDSAPCSERCHNRK